MEQGLRLLEIGHHGLVRTSRSFAWKQIVSSTKIIDLKYFGTGRRRPMRRYSRPCQPYPYLPALPTQDRTEADTHDLPPDYRLERRLRQRPQHSRRRPLAGGLGAARPGLSR